MKKSLIVLGVLAGITGVAHAENKTVLFGSIGYSVGVGGYIDRSDGLTGNAKNVAKEAFGDNEWDLKTTQSKFGIKGNEDINSGLSAVYLFEFGADVDKGVNDTKKAYLGLKGDFGQVTLGKQSAAYGSAVGFNDLMNEAGAFKSFKLDNFRKGVKYSTSMLKESLGVDVSAAAEFDGENKASKGVDLWETAAVYDSNGIFAGAAYQKRMSEKNGDKGSEEVMGTSIGYHNDTFKAGVGYIHKASWGDSYNLGGEFYAGPNTFRAEANYFDPKGGKNNTLKAALGYQYNFSERTYTWVEGNYTHLEDAKVDGYEVVVGVRHDF